ncbi:hypothetical protein L6164_025563 [Bauhinia variegata]|uniref:Uncharacterized protein n=1 Tax=Bauhinia variegata TaxID=167791 RepID=A0ACB9M0P2_BAUVA|nr:hypothetical protein L6164_025563 [Bauhinia variegata]
MVQFPEEVIVEILLRLPVKSLLRFRSVSKQWLSLISDTQFGKSHFELAYARTDRLIYIADSQVRSIDFEAPFHDDSAVARLNLPTTVSFMWPKITGSCRGLLLLENYPSLLVWNPSTGSHKLAPYSAIAASNVFTFLFGFGYDPSTDDFLIVAASYDPQADLGSAHFEFFSLKTNSWKKLEGDFPYMNHMDNARAGSLVNGAIHWLAFRHDVSQTVIVAFDLTEKKLKELPWCDGLDVDDCELVLLGGFLCLCVDVNNMWVMKEYGVQSSWTKLDKVFDIPGSYYLPICYTKGGHIVGTDGDNGLLKNNHNGELLEYREYCDDRHGCQVALYTHSLLTLPLGEAVEDRQQYQA